MDKALLDTDIFSEILKGRNPIVASNASSYHQQFGHYTFSVITIAEIIKGLQKRSGEARINKFLSSITKQEILSLDQDSAILAGRIYGELERRGQPIGRADPFIAGIALKHDLTLITGNTKHFDRVVSLGFPLRLADWRQSFHTDIS